MAKAIVRVTYRVEDTDKDIKTATEVEEQRWERFQKQLGLSPLKLEVEMLKMK